MYVIHGTWVPKATDAAPLRGDFYLWVETDAPLGPSRPRDGMHPRALTGAALGAFLDEKFGIRTAPSKKQPELSFVLPSAGDSPLPSFELSRYVEESLPDAFELVPWMICAQPVTDPLAALADLYFIAQHAPEDFQLGADLIFWHEFARVVRQVIARDQYVPALESVEPSAPEKSAKKGRRAAVATRPRFAARAGWEIVSDAYESAIPRFAAAMPLICAAGSFEASGEELWAREPLLRHFAETLLERIVTTTPFTAKHDDRFAGTLLAECLDPEHRPSGGLDDEKRRAEYLAWAAWRERLTHAQTTAGFTLGFRLDEASADNPDGWEVRFVVVSRRDPSLKLDLADYWLLSPDERATLGRAFGPAFEKDLLLALGHAARVYPKVWSGLETAAPSGLRLTLDEAYSFLREDAWVLEDAGFTVLVPAWYTPAGRRRVKVRLRTASATKKPTAVANGGYFGLNQLVAYQYQLMIGDEPVSEDEWQRLVEAKTPLVQFRGQWIELDREKMVELLEFWKKRQRAEPELTLPELLRIAAESDDELEFDHDEALGTMLDRLRDKSRFEEIDEVPNLNGSLRAYQKRGVAWLRYLEGLGLNPCLADDMGLGKTLEVIAHLVAERDAEVVAPTLVVAPTSVLGNWRKEIERFAPMLRTKVHHGGGREKSEAAFRATCREADVVITSFALARLDEKLLRSVEWRRVVVDEAQNIKNPEAAQTRALGKLSAERRVALTGTPVENRLLDLWSIFNFLNPGYLGKQAQFRKSFELPIQRNNDRERAATLKKLVEPFILRRVKTDQRIIADLPDKIEQKVFCNLTPEQASLYAAVVKDVEEQLESAEGIGRRGLILATLLRLKQICNHPTQFLQDGSAFGAERSHKLQRLTEMLEEAIASGESALVFTQFAEVGAALEKHIARTLGCATYYLHGGTSVARREKLIAAFQDPESEPAVFVLSLRAGGVGLNLTRANHVFHFDRWWNPAVEDQATDRAFRIGQRKNVFVHKFLAVGTLEERIDEMIEAKKGVASAIVGADESWLTELDNDAFKELIALRRGAVLE